MDKVQKENHDGILPADFYTKQMNYDQMLAFVDNQIKFHD